MAIRSLRQIRAPGRAPVRSQASTWVRVPGLDQRDTYEARWEGPVESRAVSKSSPLAETGPTAGTPVTGRALATRGFWVPRRRPQTVTLVYLVRS